MTRILKPRVKKSASRTMLPGSPVAPRYFSAQVSESNRFYLDVNPARSHELTVVSGGRELCRTDYDVNRKGFPFLILEFVSKGAGKLVLQGKHHDLRPGSVFVYGPGIAHRIIADHGHAMTKYFVAFAGTAARELLNECQILPDRITQVTHPEHIEKVFNDLIRHGLSDRAKKAKMCAAILQYLVMTIADHGTLESQGGTPAFAAYQRCRKFIEENFTQLRSLAEVADACHINPSYLCRLFQRFGRQSPFQYLQHLRMNRAADLLQNSNRMVKEVAGELGFSDPYNFSRAFKRMFGVYPGHLL